MKNKLPDFLASVVVFLIALPLSMGIAIASGVPPAYGLVTAIIGGILVGALGGAPLQISGPSAGLAVLIWEVIEKFGLEQLGAVVILAGLLQFIAGSLKLGRWFRAVSPAVIRGMLTGIGILIIAGQCHLMVDAKPRSSGLLNIISIPESFLKGIISAEDTVHHLAALIGFSTLVVLISWNMLRPKALKTVPGALVAAVVAAVLAAIWELPIDYVAVPSNLADILVLPGAHTLTSWSNPSLLWAATALAMVASAETLLCATAVSKMHNEGRTDYNRELVAQGLGNLLCGAVGSLPMTGVISRSTMNVEAGAKPRSSAIMHACWVLLFVALFPNVLALVPTSSLAAILVYVGYKLVDINAIKKLSSFGRPVLVIYFVTVIGIVGIDLLSGIVLGLAISSIKLIWSFSHLDIQIEQEAESARIDMRLFGSATFMGLPILAEALEDVPGGAELHMHLEYLDYIDLSCLDVISDWQKAHEKEGGRVVVEWNTLMHRYQRRGATGSMNAVDISGRTLDLTTPTNTSDASADDPADNDAVDSKVDP